jgi:hypothetical protein
MIEEVKFKENTKYIVELKMQSGNQMIRLQEELTVLKILPVPGLARIYRERNGAEWVKSDWLESNAKILYTFPETKMNRRTKIKLWIIKKLAK